VGAKTYARVVTAVAAFHHRGQVGRIELAGGEFGCRDMLGSFNHRNADGDVLGRPDLRARVRTLANRFDRKTMGEQYMMADLV
jgi:hypothetical protein